MNNFIQPSMHILGVLPLQRKQNGGITAVHIHATVNPQGHQIHCLPEILHLQESIAKIIKSPFEDTKSCTGHLLAKQQENTYL